MALTVSCADDDPTASAAPPPPPAFGARCAACHGADGLGAGDVPSLATAFETWEAEGLAAVVRAGLEDATMPAFPPDQLPEAELRAVVDWLALLGRVEGPVSDPNA